MSGKLVALRRVQGDPVEMSDAALLAACGVGDSAALGALFDRHRASVQRFLSRMAHVEQRNVDDLVQETFLQVHRSAKKFAEKSTVKTWIIGIAVNVARHHARSEMRRRKATSNFVSQPQLAVVMPTETTLQAQFVAKLQQGLAELPPELREVFVLCDLEEIPGAEAAHLLNVRQGTLWWRLSEARKRLRTVMQGARS
jgi:RNA polymerase sigma-70 factor, ECF subfamily